MPVHWGGCPWGGYSAPQLLFVSGIYGIYVPLFAAALWSSWHRSTGESKVMCAVCIIMFVVVTLQMALTMVVGSMKCPDTMPISGSSLLFQYNSRALGTLTFIAGLLSDGVLAWRCYILYNRRRCLIWLIGIAFIGIGASGMFMAVGLADGSSNNEDDAVWSPLYLAVNGAFTVLITARIFILCRRTSFGTSRSILITAGRTVVESALISWVGVFVMLLTDYYPYLFGTRMVSTYNIWGYAEPFKVPLSIAFYDVQPALAASLPAIFGISQTLIVTRVALTRFVKSPGFTATVNALTTDFASDGSQPAV